MSKKNILLVSPYSLMNYGGVQNQILKSKEYLQGDAFDLRIFCHGSDDYNNISPISINFNSSKSNVSIKYDKLLLKEAIEWADIIHIHEPFIPLLMWRLSTDKPIITTHHASLNMFWVIILKIVYKIYTRNLSIVNISVSKQSYNQASSLRSNPIIIPNFIKLKQELKFNRTGTRISFLGRDENRKGLSIFINSIDSYIINQLKPTIISNRYVKNIGIDSYLNIDETKKIQLLKETKIFVAPNTKNESFGIILLEAIANGAIVISSDIPPFKQVLNESGIYFTNKNSNQLNLVIKNTLRDDMSNIWNRQYNQILLYESDTILGQLRDLYNK